MRNYLVSYANISFMERQKELVASAHKFGIDDVFTATQESFQESKFYKKNIKIFCNERGDGYWAWKSYFIYEALKRIEEGDILFYVDAGAEIINHVEPLVKLCKKQKGILLFSAVNKNKYWTKKSCFKIMGCNSKKYWESSRVMGGYQIYIKNKRTMKFIKEYLKFSQIKKAIDDSPSFIKNFKGFVEHRHDQSIVSGLAVKYKIQAFRNPSQGGNYLKLPQLREKGEWLNYPFEYSIEPDEVSKYPTIFFNKRNSGDIKLYLIRKYSKLPKKLKIVIYKILK